MEEGEIDGENRGIGGFRLELFLRIISSDSLDSLDSLDSWEVGSGKWEVGSGKWEVGSGAE